MSKRVAIVDYAGYATSEQLRKSLLRKGYELIFASNIKDLQKPDDLDVLLFHPGTDEQLTAIEFAKAHKKIRSAIITPIPGHYFTEEIPVLDSDEPKTIIDYIEGKI